MAERRPELGSRRSGGEGAPGGSRPPERPRPGAGAGPGRAGPEDGRAGGCEHPANPSPSRRSTRCGGERSGPPRPQPASVPRTLAQRLPIWRRRGTPGRTPTRGLRGARSLPPSSMSSAFQGYPWARAHWRTSRCPFQAAIAHVPAFQGHPLARAHLRTARCPAPAERWQRSSLKRLGVRKKSPSSLLTRTGDDSRTASIILTRATLAAASAPRVRVALPGGRGSSPAAGGTPAPAAAQLLHTSRNHWRSPAGTAPPTFSRRSRGRSAQPPAGGGAGAAGPPAGRHPPSPARPAGPRPPLRAPRPSRRPRGPMAPRGLP